MHRMSADRASLLTSWLRPSTNGMLAVCMDFPSLSVFFSGVNVIFLSHLFSDRLVNKLFWVAITGHHAQSLFLFPIVFRINLIQFFDGKNKMGLGKI